MSSTRIFHTYTRLPIISTLVLFYCNYEFYRVSKGTHPWISPRLEKLGIVRRDMKPADKSPNDANSTEKKPVAPTMGRGIESWDKGEVGWTNLNGIPIPSLEMLIRPFRRD